MEPAADMTDAELYDGLMPGKETQEPITDDLFDAAARITADITMEHGWIQVKTSKYQTMYKNKVSNIGVKKFAMVGDPRAGTGIPIDYSIKATLDDELMMRIDDTIKCGPAAASHFTHSLWDKLTRAICPLGWNIARVSLSQRLWVKSLGRIQRLRLSERGHPGR